MNAQYQALRQQADRLLHKFNDVVDDRVASGGLKRDIYDIVEWCEMEKNPHSIEDKIKQVHEQLHHLGIGGTTVIDRGDVEMLIDGYEELRESVRHMPNY